MAAPRKGVASNYVAERLKRGGRVRVKLKPNKHFALPDAGRDIIMVGPGTGIAPFRAFVQERRADRSERQSWLFFGDRQFHPRFSLPARMAGGAQGRLAHPHGRRFLARSRRRRSMSSTRCGTSRRDLIDWLDGGAHFYVCGDAKAMAKDVRADLDARLCRREGADARGRRTGGGGLERDKRYLQDIY